MAVLRGAQLTPVFHSIEQFLRNAGLESVSMGLITQYASLTDSSLSPEENAKRLIAKAIPEIQATSTNPNFKILVSNLKQEITAPPAVPTPEPPAPPKFPVGADAPPIQDIVPPSVVTPAPIKPESAIAQ